ncbi:hypothetical protein FOZ60_016201 [Perkinsus olseni]|uniref:UbiA prenyltransferase domain-containing protein 1 n=1 Tax=Perkinsus olseni TaxID=32597 RepID=A0A7J6P4S1_PEROL|nr:hypothetical protein FOZ60_016201 [Perkinsus olseni]
MLDLSRVNFYLKLSRPIIWIIILPYYLFPLGGRLDLLATWRFWLGLLYFTFPVSIMMFGINDVADTDVDKYNPRKAHDYFGNQASKSDLFGLWKVILVSNMIPLVIMSIITADWIFYSGYFIVALSLNILYNLKPFAFARKAPWDLPFTPVGFLILVTLACHLNQVPLPKAGKSKLAKLSSLCVTLPDSLFDLPTPSGPCLFYASSTLTNHMVAELLDIDCDTLGGKRTTAVVIGKAYTCAFIGALILVQLLVSADCSLAALPPSKSSSFSLRY